MYAAKRAKKEHNQKVHFFSLHVVVYTRAHIIVFLIASRRLSDVCQLCAFFLVYLSVFLLYGFLFFFFIVSFRKQTATEIEHFSSILQLT